MPSARRLKAVFFDMDDTILEPLPFNPWARFKAHFDLPQELLILEGVATKPEPHQQVILAELLSYERELSVASRLREGIEETLTELKDLGLETALVTNNHTRATQIVLDKHGLNFSLVLTRDDAAPKPSPDLLIKALEHFQLSSSEVAYVGDSKGDLDACRHLDIPVFFLATPHNPDFSPRFEYPSQLLEALLGMG